MTGTSPPGPFRCGSTTCSVKAGADRERGGEGKRVDFGGGRIIKKKKNITMSISDYCNNIINSCSYASNFFLIDRFIVDYFGRFLIFCCIRYYSITCWDLLCSVSM